MVTGIFIVWMKKRTYFGAIKTKLIWRKEERMKGRETKKNEDEPRRWLPTNNNVDPYTRLHIPSIFSKFIWWLIIFVGFFLFISTSTLCVRVCESERETIKQSMIRYFLFYILLTVSIRFVHIHFFRSIIIIFRGCRCCCSLWFSLNPFEILLGIFWRFSSTFMAG